MKKFKFTINGSDYDVEIVNIEDNIAEVEVNGTSYNVQVNKQIQTTKTPKLVRSIVTPSTDIAKSEQRTSKPSEVKGAGFIKSPLPGVILNVHVREGDIVKMGDKLITLEAMKMENSVNADKEGKILKINVRQGDSVMEGDVLVEIGG
ncbi:MAG: biotin/lipoyl-binding protein [Ignavibacteriales bacterium]|nr:biotin/lipoyl-binding protein [Ignavibacteriales bacterium]MBK7978614.1 biotin/lipoyl-binding protein [Ignavibacteriota bacterium]